MSTGKEVAKYKDGGLGVGAWSPDGKMLAFAGTDLQVQVTDSASGKVLRKLKGPKESIKAVAFSPDGKWLATGGWDEFVRVWDVRTGKRLHSKE